MNEQENNVDIDDVRILVELLNEDNISVTEYVEACSNMQKICVSLPLPVKFDGSFSTSEYSIKDWRKKLKEEYRKVNDAAKSFDFYMRSCHSKTSYTPEKSSFDERIKQHNEKQLVKMKNRLAEELIDVITACTSWLAALGYNLEARARLQREVNKKNERRGYFDEPKKNDGADKK